MIAKRYIRAIITYNKCGVCVIAPKNTFGTLDCILDILSVHNNNDDFWQIIAVTAVLPPSRSKNIHRQCPDLNSGARLAKIFSGRQRFLTEGEHSCEGPLDARTLAHTRLLSVTGLRPKAC